MFHSSHGGRSFFEVLSSIYVASNAIRAHTVQVGSRVYVAAWAGDSVKEQVLQPSFNLMLRLLIALCKDVIIPVSPDAAAVLVEDAKPFESGAGIMRDYSVQQHTSAHTDLEV